MRKVVGLNSTAGGVQGLQAALAYRDAGGELRLKVFADDGHSG